MFLLQFIMFLEKFNFEINPNNTKKVLKALQKMEEEEHQFFLEKLKKINDEFDKKNEIERNERLQRMRDKDEFNL